MNRPPFFPARRIAPCAAALLLLAPGSRPAPGADPGQDATPPPDARDIHKQVVATWYARDLDLARTRTNGWVRPGLVADRDTRTVRVYGESIRLKLGDPVEFPLIAEHSGKDYEALAVSFAQPGDIHRALEFIGLRPGAATDPAELRFWPRGERVRVTFDLIATNGVTTPFGRVEPLVKDTRTEAPLSDAGFVFCGARWTNLTDDTASATGLVYTADVFSPNAIVSIYNEPNTVLDVPRRAPQHDVYTFQVPNPDRRLPDRQLLQITFAPEFPDGAARLIDWKLRLLALTNGTPAFSVQSSNGKTSLSAASESALGEAARDAIRPGCDVFATLLIDDGIPLGTLTAACTAIDRLEETLGLRIEPPSPGQPYFRTFLPNPEHRDRTRRPMQPFELTLGPSGSGATGLLTRVTEEWKDGADEPVYHSRSWPAASARDLEGPFSEKEAPAVLLVFAPESLTYGQLHSYLAVAVARRMILYVFTAPPPTAAGSAPAPRTTP